MPSSRGSSWPKNQTSISYVSCFGTWVLYYWHHVGSPRKTFKYPQINFHVQVRSKGTKTAARNRIGGGVQFFFFLVNLILKIFFLLCLIHFLEQERVLLTQVNSSTYEKKSNQDHMFEVRPSKYPGTIVKLDLMGIHECLDCLFSVENRK